MYIQLAIIAVMLFLFSTVAVRIEKSLLSGPILFAGAGFVCGPAVLGWFTGDVTETELRVVSDLTLAFVLFIDAGHANLRTLRRHYIIPGRMLVFGLPGCILLGFLLALVLIDSLSVIEAAILATILAATDAALGKAVICNESVPDKIREGLNAESGLNDGLCVPILLVLIALAQADPSHGGSTAQMAVTLVMKELGIGMLVGIGLTAIAALIIRFTYRIGWLNMTWLHIAVIALALSCFAIAQTVHGSGYIAAFTGGMLFGYLMKEHNHDLLSSAESEGEMLALITWLIFGAAVIGDVLPRATVATWIYAVLSLTVVRMLPIVLSLRKTGESLPNRLFMGWFGPRGLASVVFAIMVINADLPGAEDIATVVACTITLSLLLHGITANPFIRLLKKYSDAGEQKTLPDLSSGEGKKHTNGND